MTTTTEVLTGPRPSLHLTESRLERAFDALNAQDPDGHLTQAEAQEVIESFVSADSLAERRDEFAQFLIEAECFASSKEAHAKTLLQQASKVRAGIDRMKQGAVEIMKRVGVAALQGKLHVLKLKKSPGAVEIVDETIIPEEFWRSRQSPEFQRVLELASMVDRYARASMQEIVAGDLTDEVMAADEDWKRSQEILAAVQFEARVIDKKAIQDEWKANGEIRQESDQKTGEITESPMVPGARKNVTTDLKID